MATKFNRAACLLAGATLFGSSQAYAEIDDVNVDFSGFSSIIFGQTITSDQGQVYNIPTDLELNKFNVLGLRLDVDLKQKLSFTTQFIAYGSDNYEPKIDWLNVSYHFTPEITLTAGRSRIPFYFFSDTLDVGYSYIWITPPEAVYGTEAVRSVDGLSFRFTKDIAPGWGSDLSVWAGNSQQELEETQDLLYTIKDMIGASWAVNHDWLTLRGIYATGLSNIDIGYLLTRPLQAGNPDVTLGGNFNYLQQQIPSSDFNGVADAILLEDKRTYWRGVGVMVEVDQFFFISEYNQLRIENVLTFGKVDSVYATFGWILPADVTIALTYSYDDNQADDTALKRFEGAVAGADLSNPEVSAVVAGTRAVLEAAAKRPVLQQNTYNLTTRWDFHPQAAFKVEYQYQDRRLADNVKQRPQSLRAAIDVVF